MNKNHATRRGPTTGVKNLRQCNNVTLLHSHLDAALFAIKRLSKQMAKTDAEFQEAYNRLERRSERRVIPFPRQKKGKPRKQEKN